MLSDNCFISEAIEERRIEMEDGTIEVVHFKHLVDPELERYRLWIQSGDEDQIASARTRLLAMGLCNPDGSAALTREQAIRIKRPVLERLIAAMLDVNGYGKKSDVGNG